MPRFSVMNVPDMVMSPWSVTLDAALRLAKASVSTWLPVTAASGSAALALALGAALRVAAGGPPHAVTARQLAPVSAIAARPAGTDRPRNIQFSAQNTTYLR